MKQEGKTRHDYGREAFIEKVWEWKKEYGNRITMQLRRLGGSVDWNREAFTMDANLSKAVQVRAVTFSLLCPLLEKYGTFIARCNALIEKVSPCIGVFRSEASRGHVRAASASIVQPRLRGYSFCIAITILAPSLAANCLAMFLECQRQRCGAS
eukprot:SAG31_NODE_245_length_19224_cov_10.210614_2_plen_154_part_00